jgi:hypothetical protein
MATVLEFIDAEIEAFDANLETGSSTFLRY